MRCRHFTLRLTAQHASDDEARLNAFLQTVKVHTVQTSTGAPGCWSVLVFYEEVAGQAGLLGEGGSIARPDEASGRATGRARGGSAAGAPDEAAALTPEQQRIYEQLREWRKQRAAAEGKPAYVVAHNAVLLQIAREHMSMRAVEDLLGIGQFGEARAARYGPDILQLLAALAERDEAPLFEESQ